MPLNIENMSFLPTSIKEMRALGWDRADIILFSGDAYVDHPAFGVAVIGRLLEREGYRVAIVPQPNWRDDLRDFRKLGTPRLFFGVTAGNMDSMVNHYTANKRLRSDDAYTPEGRAGYRPDYAVTVYSNILKRLYPDVPLVIGGIEASLRRLTHYDYWTDGLKPSILVDSGADLLVYGMGEAAITRIAERLSNGYPINQLTDIPQTAYIENKWEERRVEPNTLVISSYEECLASKEKFGQNFRVIETESNRLCPARLIEPIGNRAVIVNTPFPLPSVDEVDSWYDLPYTRLPHPRYRGKTIPAFEMIKFSVNIHRGCFGGCSFCTISAHQGKFIVSRSRQSIVREVEAIKRMPDFKGYLSDLGGPSANMYTMRGRDLSVCERCKRPSCIHPSICKNLNASHEELNRLYDAVSSLDGIRKAFIGSGVRYDLFVDRDSKPEVEYFSRLVRNHVSGRLKVAPEHTSDKVLKLMRKPSFRLFKILKQKFEDINRKYNINQQLIPYFISSHPGSTEDDMRHLAEETRKLNFRLEQVQDFTPTPMTLASTIYYTGVDPYTGEKVYVAKTRKEKQRQLSYFFWYKTGNPKTDRGKPTRTPNR
jgi:uncharacterized radical SAM protein YgiQ